MNRSKIEKLHGEIATLQAEAQTSQEYLELIEKKKQFKATIEKAKEEEKKDSKLAKFLKGLKKVGDGIANAQQKTQRYVDKKEKKRKKKGNALGWDPGKWGFK